MCVFTKPTIVEESKCFEIESDFSLFYGCIIFSELNGKVMGFIFFIILF